MSAKQVKNMKRRRKELLAELEQIDQALKVLGAYEELPTSSASGSSGGGGPKPHAGPKPRQVLEEAKRILLEKNFPMTRGELYEALQNAGFEFAGDKAVNTLGVTLSRHGDTFVNLKGYGYWLVDFDCPKANYYAVVGATEDETPGKPEPERAYVQ